MKYFRAALLFIFCTAVTTSYAATAATTLQMIWPNEELGLDQGEALNKAVEYLNSEDYRIAVASMNSKDRQVLTQETGINNIHNIKGLAQGLQKLITVDPDAEHGVITIFANCSDSDFAITLATRCANVATRESRYRIAEKEDPNVEALKQQMEQVEDQIQQYQQQLELKNDQRRFRRQTNSRGASIGAPINMGRVVNPEGMQAGSQTSVIKSQIQQLRDQYRGLSKQLNVAVNEAWKGHPKLGLVVVDKADLEPESGS
ncbi:MAG: hypothetical protein ACQKBV_07310 [Puniceicoccales bacterium]